MDELLGSLHPPRTSAELQELFSSWVFYIHNPDPTDQLPENTSLKKKKKAYKHEDIFDSFQMVKITTVRVHKLAYTSSLGGGICLTMKVLENMGGKSLKEKKRKGWSWQLQLNRSEDLTSKKSYANQNKTFNFPRAPLINKG